jgi:DNA-binding CsgD family transcriptional regulator
VDYRYILEGFDKDWHYTNADKAFATYTNLDAGNYTLIVEATDNNKQWIVPATRIEIGVVPPFWRTIGFKLLLAVVVCWLAYTFYRQKIAIKQKEVEKLKNEKLQAEIKIKEEILIARNSELTSSVVHLSNKNEILQEIKRDLRSIKYVTDIKDISKTLNRVSVHIDQNFVADNNWEQFEMHFNQVNHNFLVKLKKEFPDLTQTNLKLCAYLRMNLGSKEIASLMNISPNAVLKSKYRLKLKFQLQREQDLIDFLSNY